MDLTHAAAIGTFLGTGLGDARPADVVRLELGPLLLAQLLEGGWLVYDRTSDAFLVTAQGKADRAAYELAAA